MAQHASDKTSASARWSSWIREGSTCKNEVQKKIINPGRQTSSSEDLPDGLQTAEDKGSYCDTNWTMSMLGYGGIQPKKKVNSGSAGKVKDWKVQAF